MSSEPVQWIDARKVIVNTFKASEKKSITLELLEYLVDELSKKYKSAAFIVNTDAIEKTVLYNGRTFELVGDTIFLKTEIPEIMAKKCEIDKDMSNAIRSFVLANPC